MRPKSTETKQKKRTVILCAWTAGLAWAIAGVLASIIHNPFPAIVSLLIGIIFGAIGLRLELINHGSKHRNAILNCAWIVAPGMLICVILLWKKGFPEPSTRPHFVFGIVTDGDLLHPLQLTNDCLQVRYFNDDFTNLNGIPTNFNGYVVFPVTQKSNAVVTFLVQNSGTASLEEGEVSVSIPRIALVQPEPGWSPSQSKNSIGDTVLMTEYKVDSWTAYSLTAILPGNGTCLPSLRLQGLNWGASQGPSPNSILPILLTGRAKDSPAQGIAFSAWFILVPTNATSLEPFVMQGNGAGGGQLLNPPEKRKAWFH